jgi:hypothetical protein
VPAAHPRFDRKRIIVAAILAASVVTGFAGIAGSACSPQLASQVATQGASADPNSPHTGPQARQDVQAVLDKLAASADRTYTAEYAVATGAPVTVSQAPPKHSYRSADAFYVVTPEEAVSCKAKRCDREPGADELGPAQTKAVAAAMQGRFLPLEDVVARMDDVVDSPDARSGRANRTIGGGPADCVAVTASGISPQTTCVTAAGILAYFAGSLPSPNGETEVRMELRNYTPNIVSTAFNTPS